MTIRNTTLLFAFLFAGIAECDSYPLSLLDAEASASTRPHVRAPVAEDLDAK